MMGAGVDIFNYSESNKYGDFNEKIECLSGQTPKSSDGMNPSEAKARGNTRTSDFDKG